LHANHHRPVVMATENKIMKTPRYTCHHFQSNGGVDARRSATNPPQTRLEAVAMATASIIAVTSLCRFVQVKFNLNYFNDPRISCGADLVVHRADGMRMGCGWDHQIRTEKVCKQQVF
jgi:hypothetical protein